MSDFVVQVGVELNEGGGVKVDGAVAACSGRG